MAFTLEELGECCLQSLMGTTRGLDPYCSPLESFPLFDCHANHNSRQRCVGFWISEDELSGSIDEFAGKYVPTAMQILRYRVGEAIQLSTELLELPYGCNAANAKVEGVGSMRVIVFGEPVPDRTLFPLPRGTIRRFYDIQRNAFFRWEIGTAVRLDVLIAAEGC